MAGTASLPDPGSPRNRPADAEGWDAAPAKALPGVPGVVKAGGGVAVVADSMWAGMRGARAMPVRWKATGHDDLTSAAVTESMKDGLKAPAGAVAKGWGDVEGGLRGAARVLEAEYEVPFLSHTPKGPFNVKVRIEGEYLGIWARTQNQDRLVNRVVRDTGRDPRRVRPRTVLQGGGYGRRLHEDMVHSAATVARALGKPLKLSWAREDEIGQGWCRPAQTARFRAGLDASGKPVALSIRTAGTSTQRDFVGRQRPPIADAHKA